MSPAACDGTVEHCQFKDSVRAVIKEALAEEQMAMQPARCAGHQELLKEVTEARSDIRHLVERLDEYMTRKDRTEAELSAQVLDLRLHGAEISRQNAADIVLLISRMEKVEQHCKTEAVVEKEEKKNVQWWDNAILKWTAIITVALVLASTVLEYYRLLTGYS